MHSVRLLSGYDMPTVGLGTWQVTNNIRMLSDDNSNASYQSYIFYVIITNYTIVYIKQSNKENKITVSLG